MGNLTQLIKSIPLPAGVENWPNLKWNYLLSINACYIYLNCCLCFVNAANYLSKIPFENESLATDYFLIFYNSPIMLVILFDEGYSQILFKMNHSFFKKQLIFFRIVMTVMHVMNLKLAFFLDKITLQITYVDKTVLFCSVFGIFLQILEYCHFRKYGKEQQLKSIILFCKKLCANGISNEQQERISQSEQKTFDSHNLADTRLQKRYVQINKTGGSANQDIEVTVSNAAITSKQTENYQNSKVIDYISTDNEEATSSVSFTPEMLRHLTPDKDDQKFLKGEALSKPFELATISQRIKTNVASVSDSSEQASTVNTIRSELKRSWHSFDNLTVQSLSDSSDFQTVPDSTKDSGIEDERQTLDEKISNIVSKHSKKNEDSRLTEKLLGKENLNDSLANKFRAPATISNEGTVILIDQKNELKIYSHSKALSLLKRSYNKKREEAISIMNIIKDILIEKKKEKSNKTLDVPPKGISRYPNLETSSNITDNASSS